LCIFNNAQDSKKINIMPLDTAHMMKPIKNYLGILTNQILYRDQHVPNSFIEEKLLNK